MTPEQKAEFDGLVKEMANENCRDIFHLGQGEFYQGPSGSYWQMFWDRRNTESQENQYDDLEPVLVKRIERVVFEFVPVES